MDDICNILQKNLGITVLYSFKFKNQQLYKVGHTMCITVK